jgi:tRNA nucleotidyltransferase (CCA-adding enzyme)
LSAPAAAVIRMQDYDLLKVIHPSIKLNKDLISLLNSVKNVLAWYDLLFLDEPLMRWSVYLMALIRHCDIETSKSICKHFELRPRHHGLFTSDRRHAHQCMMELERRLPARNSTLYRRLHGFKAEHIIYMMAATRQERVKKAISHYYTTLRNIALGIQGRDLKEIGLKPGPVYRKILEHALAAKLDGRLKTRADELAFARKQAARI